MNYSFKKPINKNRPPSELEIKSLIAGKKIDDDSDEEIEMRIKDADDKQVLAIIASDSSGEDSENENESSNMGKTVGANQSRSNAIAKAAAKEEVVDDFNMTEQAGFVEGQKGEEELDDKTRKKQHLKRLKHLLAAQNDMLEGKNPTKALEGQSTTAAGTVTAIGTTTRTQTVTMGANETGGVSTSSRKLVFSKADALSRMEKWDQADRNNPLNQKFMPLKDFKGIAEERRCTNITFLILWVLLNSLFFFCAVIAFMNGVPDRLSNGNDFRGDVCGVGHLSDRAYQYFVAATVDTQVSICISECPTTTGQDICLYNVNGIVYPNEWSQFCYQQLASVYLGRYCIPKEPLNRQAVDAYMSTTRNTVKRLFSDLNLTLEFIFVGMIVSIILSFSMQLIMRKEERVPYLIWGCIIGSFLCFCIMSYLFHREYQRLINFYCLLSIDKHSCGGSRAYLFYNLYWIVLIIAGVYMLVVMKLYNRINLAIGFIKASSRVVAVLGQLNFVPFVSVIFAILTGVVTIYACIYALTIGNIVLYSTASGAIENDQAKGLEYSSYSVYMVLLMFYMFYNWQNFTLGVNNMITSFALCIWFFTKRKETVKIPIAITLKRIFRYHIGTVSLYILIEPIFRIPKLIIDTVERILRSLPQQSQFVRYIQGFFSCFLNFNGSFLRYISLQSFVQTSLFGDGFGTASKTAFFLINRHKEKLKDLDFLITFMIFQIKLSCSLFIAMLVYIYISNGSYTPIMSNNLSQVESPILPSTVVFIACYQIADIFQGSFNMACKTIIQCYFVDKEMFVGEQRFVEKFIRDFMEFYSKEDLTTFKLKSQKQAIITQGLKNKLIKNAVKRNFHNEFEAQNVDLEAAKKDAISNDSDEDEENNKKKSSDESDSYVIEEEGENDHQSDGSDGLNIGNREPKQGRVLEPAKIQIRPAAKKDTKISQLTESDNASVFSAGESLKTSGLSFFDIKKIEDRNLSSAGSSNSRIFNLNRGQQSRKNERLLFPKRPS